GGHQPRVQTLQPDVRLARQAAVPPHRAQLRGHGGHLQLRGHGWHLQVPRVLYRVRAGLQAAAAHLCCTRTGGQNLRLCAVSTEIFLPDGAA
ncbi:unnamed protein product, partial [Lampetra planeri]